MNERESVVRYGDRCIRVKFPAEQPDAVFLVRGLSDMSDVDVEGTIIGHPDLVHFYKAEVREIAREFAFRALMEMCDRESEK